MQALFFQTLGLVLCVTGVVMIIRNLRRSDKEVRALVQRYIDDEILTPQQFFDELHQDPSGFMKKAIWGVMLVVFGILSGVIGIISNHGH